MMMMVDEHQCTEKKGAGPAQAAPAPVAMEPKAAGLEFAAGVHLIEEMENQVKQWEESESSRQVAYQAWVSQQMMARAAAGQGAAVPTR